MDRFDVELKKEVDQFLENNIHFTPEEENRMLEKVRQKRNRRLSFNPVYWTVVVAAASLFIFFSVYFVSDSGGDLGASGGQGSQERSLYGGKALTIGVLGTPPDVKETQVAFQELSLEQFTIEKVRDFDAVFIMKENLIEAAEEPYTEVFTDSHIPFFFIESNKGAYPFNDETLGYEEAREIPYHDYYAHGYLVTIEGMEMTWPFESTEGNNAPAFSKIFQTIEKVLPQTFDTEP